MPGPRPSSGALVVVVAVVLAALACFGSGVEAISCYDCNSANDPRCGDPFDPYSIGSVDCNLRPRQDHLNGMNATLCRKQVQRVGTESGTKIRVIRTCGYIEDAERDGGCVSRSGTHDVTVLYCSCKGDLCNAAPANTPVVLLLPGLFAVLSVLRLDS